jgi:hypothetical protein
MDTALIVGLAAIAVLIVVWAARRGWSRSLEARREKASELRVEATQRQERARRAEIEADREREEAEARATRAERIDPDTESGGGAFSRFRRGRDEDDRSRDDEERGADSERRNLWDRLVHR